LRSYIFSIFLINFSDRVPTIKFYLHSIILKVIDFKF
jgi:hypothetical protein